MVRIDLSDHVPFGQRLDRRKNMAPWLSGGGIFQTEETVKAKAPKPTCSQIFGETVGILMVMRRKAAGDKIREVRRAGRNMGF